MPKPYWVATLLITALATAEAAKHYWGMSLLRMSTYHLFSLAFDVVVAGGAIACVWLTAERANRAMHLKNDQLARLTEDLRRTEGMKDQLTAMIVHDLRSPLTGLMGGLQMMGALSRTGSSDRLWEYHRMAWTSTQRMARLVDHLLDITKMESGEMPLRLESLSVEQLVTEAVEQSRLSAESRQARVAVQVVEGLPPINGDRQLLLRVLDNLIGNALKFSPVGTAVRVSAAEVTLQGGGPGIAIAVSDDGPGIPPEYHERIFDKFGIVAASQAGVRPSTGLGLAFCKLAVQAHGGRIWVESEEGAGSRFSVTLPANRLDQADSDRLFPGSVKE